MRLNAEDHSQETRTSLLVFFLFCIPLACLGYFTHTSLNIKQQKFIYENQQTQTILEKNRADIEEMRIIQGNQEEINATWNVLNHWNQGSINQDSAKILTESGFGSVTPFVNNPTGPGIPANPRPGSKTRPGIAVPPPIQNSRDDFSTYSKIQARSEKSEFLRLITAIYKIEQNEGLTQIEKATISLPNNVPPYQNTATYLNTELLLATPNTIR